MNCRQVSIRCSYQACREVCHCFKQLQGDNISQEYNFADLLENATKQTSNATMFACAGIYPKHYDMMEFDLKGKAIT